MIIPASAPLPPNGFDPLPAARITRTQAELASMDLREKTARAAVLGYCHSAIAPLASTGAARGSPFLTGFNLLANIFRTPTVALPVVTSSSTVTSSGSGVLDGSSQDQPVSPTVVPMGEATPNPPQYGPLTLQNTRNVQGWCAVTQPRNATQPVAAGTGPQWGDPFSRTVLASTTASTGGAILSWMQEHGALAATLFVGGLLVAGAAMGSRRKGR